MVSLTRENNGFLNARETPARVLPSSSWKKARRITLAILIAFAACWVILSTWSEIVYHKSRPKSLGPPTGFEFNTRGVKASMTEVEVNRTLVQADRVLPHLYANNPPWKGFINTYEFTYGPEINFLVTKAKIPFIKESMDVYFDLAGRPKKINVLVKRLDWPSTRAEVDLENRKVITINQNLPFSR